MEETVEDERTGRHFPAGDAQDLAGVVEWAWSHPEQMAAMGRAARAEYETHYTAKGNYKRLIEIYRRAMATDPLSGAVSNPSLAASRS